MTGFGQAAAESGTYRVTATLRSVNHRFLDLGLRLRDERRDLEQALRARAGKALSRGRVDVQIEIESLVEQPRTLRVDEPLLAAVTSLAARLGDGSPPSVGDLLRVPDLIRFEAEETTWDDADTRAALDAFDRALAQLVESRQTEGAKLEAILSTHLETIEAVTASLGGRASEAPLRSSEALARRLDELLGDGVAPDPDRLAQEVAILADRSDVQEELDRLRAHAAHFRELMARSGAVGKRLDFLSQEVLRELNTIGAKCRDAEMTRLVLDGKASSEQIREQIQNVE